MTEPELHDLPTGDTFAGLLTRVMYVSLPPGPDARAKVLPSGETILAIRPGLTRAERRTAVRYELHRLGRGRSAAFVLFGVDALRRTVQPVQRVAHFVEQIPQSIHDATWGPAVVTVSATVAVVGIAGGAVMGSGIMDRPHHATGPAFDSPQWHERHPVHVRLRPEPLAYLGAYEPSSPNSYTGMETFAQICGRQPNAALYYLGWGGDFNTEFGLEAAEHGAIPVIQWNPEFPATVATGEQHLGGPGTGVAESVSLAAIASGSYDDYLTGFADQVADYGRAVVISFGPEVNGNWYPWSAQPASDYVAAWRHIVAVFHKQGADNVTWMMTYNRVYQGVSPDVLKWWPGSDVINWVGIDGYYRRATDTWLTVFASTISVLHTAGINAPEIISETAIGPPRGKVNQLANMYANIRAYGLLGLIWFDEDKPRQPYDLADDPGAAREFREETLPWRLAHQVPRRGMYHLAA